MEVTVKFVIIMMMVMMIMMMMMIIIIIVISYYNSIVFQSGRLCGLVVRVSGYRYRGPGFDSRRYQIF